MTGPMVLVMMFKMLSKNELIVVPEPSGLMRMVPVFPVDRVCVVSPVDLVWQSVGDNTPV